MRKFKIGDKVRIVKPLCVRKCDGRIENFKDRVVEVRTVEFSKCCCDLGLSTIEMVDENNNTHDASNIINKYIRSAYFCSLTDSGKSLLVTVDSETFTGTSGQKQTIKIAFDEDDKRLYLDRMNGEEPILIAEEIHRIEWMIAMNGVKYSAYTVKASGDESLYFFGYAHKRGR